jgi:hypothetical protein
MKTFSGLLLGLLTAGMFSGTAFALTVPVAEDTYTSPTKTGTSIAETSGAATSLPVNAKETALLQFDLENLDAVPLTITGLNLNSAILQLYVTSALPAGDLTVHAVTTPWSEHFAGKTAAEPTISPTVLATIPGAEIGKKDFVTVDVTAAVKSALTSGSFDGFAIEASGTTKVAIASKEGPASGYAAQLFLDASNGPQANNDTVIGAGALTSSTDGESSNTAFGYQALENPTTGGANVAVGGSALKADTTGGSNVAVGNLALVDGTSASFCTAVGASALRSAVNGNGAYNCAFGFSAMADENGGFNVAMGVYSLQSGTNSASNVAVGAGALSASQGSSNTCVGYNTTNNGANTANVSALGRETLTSLSTGNGDVAIGYRAGSKITSGNNNVYVGNADSGGNSSEATSESNTIRIGAPDQHTATFIAGIVGQTTGVADAVPVVIDSNGQLGTLSSSRRYKEDIQEMGDASARLLRLRPVTFRYKKPYADGGKPIQYGLIAEDVAQVFPELVVRNAKGEPETVKYQLLAPLLLNEFLKEHERVKEETGKVGELEQRIAAQEKTNAALAASLAEIKKEVTLVAHKMNERAIPVANVTEGSGKVAGPQ